MNNINRNYSNYCDNQTPHIYSKFTYSQNGYHDYYDLYNASQSPCASSTSSSKTRKKEKRTYYHSDDNSDIEIRKKPRNGILNESLKPETTEEVDTIEEVLDTRLGIPGETGDETTIYNSIYNTNASYQPSKGSEQQYLIKWKNWSYVHATWESEESLKARGRVEGRKKLDKYIQFFRETERYKNSCTPDELERRLFAEEQIRETNYMKMQADRIIHKQYDKGGTLEYFVKWKLLDYKFVTAESAESVVEPLFKNAIFEYENHLKSNKIPNNDNKFLFRRPVFYPLTKNCPFGRPGSQLSLRDYQEIGVNWMMKLWTVGHNGILADEMGLGKTIQIVAFISTLFRRYDIFGPYLLIVPLSTIDNWKKEFNIWAPEIYTVVYTGDIASRDIIRKYEWCQPNSKKLKFNVLLTTYEIVMNDKMNLSSIFWTFLGVDEAHRLKSSESKLYKMLFHFKTNCRFLITGTPLQNNIKELWSLLRFINPKDFDSFEQFEHQFGNSGNETLCNEKLANLREAISPFIIRREKKDVEKSLPAKSEQILRINMSRKQKELYRLILAKNFDSLLAETNKRTVFKNVIVELKKCCNHVELIADKLKTLSSIAERQEYLIKSSGKMIVLDKLLTHLRAENHRVLIFSQMVRMLDILDDYLCLKGWGFQRLDGSRSSLMRNEAIKNFNAINSTDFCFLLSTRAGGLGINLTTADTVIIFDSDWNPHADLQAMARAHRIGQTKQVSIYRFVIKNSVEEKIIERAKRKMVLDHLVIQRMEADGTSSKNSKSKLEADDFEAILRFSAQEIFKECDDNDDTDFNLQTILKQAEIRDQDTTSATNAFLSSFKVISLDPDPLDEPVEISNEAESKTWSELIPKKYIDTLNKNRGDLNAIIDSIPKKSSNDSSNISSKNHQNINSTNNIKQNFSQSNNQAAKLNKIETRKLVTTIQKFGCPHKRLDKIQSETQLTKLTELQLCNAIVEIIDGCRKLVVDNCDSDELGSLTYEYNGYQIAAKTLVSKIDSLNELHLIMTQYSEEDRIRNQFITKTKPTSWNCEWSCEDDNRLLVGVFEHGMSSWKDIKYDPRLKLKNKILRSDKSILPQEKHLTTRIHYLLDVLTKCKQPIKLKFKLGGASLMKRNVVNPTPNSIDINSTNNTSKISSSNTTNNKLRIVGGESVMKPPARHKSESMDNNNDNIESDTDSSLSSISHKSSNNSDSTSETDPKIQVDLDDFSDQEFVSFSGAMFSECKSFLKECRKELAAVQKILTNNPNKHEYQYLDYNIITVGDRIKSVVQDMKPNNKSHYFRYLWQFVKIFCPNYSASDLFDLYKSAISKKDY